MKPACLRAGFLLQRRAAGLSAAAGLSLEEHLASCAACRGQANLLHDLRALHAHEAQTLRVERRAHVIAVALAGATGVRPLAAALPGSRHATWLLLPAAALAGLVFLGTRALRTDTVTAPHAERATPRTAPLVQGDRVLSGQVDCAGSAYAAGQPLAPDAQLHTPAEQALLALAHATVTLRGDSRARWNAGRHELQLSEGSVFLDVDPAAHARFSVVTARFSVLVLGTAFEVSLDTVKVSRGRVQVLAPDGRELALLDAAGQSEFRLEPSSAPKSRELPAHAHASAAGSRPEPLDPDALLERARSELGERHVSGARRVLERVLTHTLSREQRAEALSLRAESELVAGKYRAARAAYLSVAEQFAALPAGETARFAAARIEAEHGEPSYALRLLASYLERYPSGRFAREATTRTQALSGPSPSP
jgi:hypothetical protein